MVSSSASALLRFAGWTYLPDTIASTALTFIHRAYTSISGRPSPQKGTPSYHRNYRYVFATVVLGYLAYNMIEASRLMPANFYELLGVHPDANENQLKAGFRTFARRNHPDKVGPEGETLFIQVRDAYEALKNPVTRFAYDRYVCIL
jgi:preprotein translocase subunit Sec63